MASTNALIQAPTLPHGAPSFASFKEEDFLPALEWALEESRKNMKGIVENSEEPNFANTLHALEVADEELDRITSIFFNLLSAHSSDAMHEIAQKISPKLAEYSNDVSLNPQLFERIKKVYDNRDKASLNQEEVRILELTYRSFVRSGALLSDDEKAKLRKIDEESSQLGPQFSQNLLKETNSFELLIEDESIVKGIPEFALAAARETAAAKKKENAWVFTLHAPSFVPFLTYCSSREHREKIWRASSTRATQGEHSNLEIILKMIELRSKRAQLLGYKSHSDYVLSERMAGSKESVQNFIEKIIKVSLPAAKRELEELQNFAKTEGFEEKLQPWDISFYSEKLKQKKFDFSDEALRPYFPIHQVIDGLFQHAEKLFDLEFKESKDYSLYHEDVKVYEVFDQTDKKFMGLFYADFFPRKSKKEGAWMTTFRDQGKWSGKEERPLVGIVCNFTKPTQNTPSLLSFTEVVTLFHEFGHSLHALLSKCEYRTLSGTNVFWDFVELPSQIMENWVREKEGLLLFAKHHEDGSPMPEELLKNLLSSMQFMAGWASLRQAQFAYLDLMWHSTEPSEIDSVEAFEKKHGAKTRLMDPIPGSIFSPSFSHIFSGGYSSGYYSYKWAEVLEADAFELFKEKGLFHKESAQSFKENILEKGGSEHPMDLYKKFRGREPDPEALFKREGLL